MAKYNIKADGSIIRASDKSNVTNETACEWVELDEGGITKSVTYREVADFLAPLKQVGSFRMNNSGQVWTKVLVDDIWRHCEFHPEVIGWMPIEDFVASP